MKILAQNATHVLVQLQRTKYLDPHQGKRERKRRLRQMIMGQLPRPSMAAEADLIHALLELSNS